MDDTKRSLRVFLCHASSDKPAVRKLYERLVKDGVDAWLDKEKLIPGQNWQIEIPRAVNNSDVVIVCVSSQSVTKEGFVQKEIKFALDIADEKPDGTIFIIPARLESCDVPNRISKYHWVDLFSDDGYEWLIKALQIRAENVGAIIKPKKNNQNLPPKTENQFHKIEKKVAVVNKDIQSAFKHNNESILSDDTAVPKVDNIISIVFSWKAKFFIGIPLVFVVAIMAAYPLLKNTTYYYQIVMDFAGAFLFPYLFLYVFGALVIYPHKVSIILAILGFIIASIVLSPYDFYDFTGFISAGFIGFSIAALISRILHWLKVLK